MIFEELDEYKRDVKKLSKRFRSLYDDLELLKKVLKICPQEQPPHSYRISELGIDAYVVKHKRVACRSLKGRGSNTGLRVVYAYLKEDEKIVLIEIYHKADKENEDRKRILKHFKINK